MLKIKFFLILAIASLLFSCVGDNELEFKTVTNLQISDLTKKKIDLTGDLLFYNKTATVLSYDKCVADVKVDGVDLNTFFHRRNIKVKENEEFSIPLKLSISPSEIINKDAETVSVTISGEIEYVNDAGLIRVLPFSFSQTVNVTDEKGRNRKSRDEESGELNERELKRLEKKLEKGKIDSLEYKEKVN